MGFASDTTNKYTDLLVSPCLTDLPAEHTGGIAARARARGPLPAEATIFTGIIRHAVNISYN